MVCSYRTPRHGLKCRSREFDVGGLYGNCNDEPRVIFFKGKIHEKLSLVTRPQIENSVERNLSNIISAFYGVHVLS